MRRQLHVLTANIGSVGHQVDELLYAINKWQPHVVVVTEAYNARSWLRQVPGYKLRQYRGREARGIAVLVKRELRIVRRRPLRMAERWTGPGGNEHAPRTYPAFVLWDGQRRWPFVAVHLPSGGPAGPNAKAWAESWRRLSTWLEERPEAASAGDWNALARELVPRLRTLQLIVGTKVDHAVTHGLSHLATTRLAPPPDMHGWLVYKLQG